MSDDTALPILGQRVGPLTARHVLEACLASGADPARSLYIHTPFCAHKCHYCDFYSFVDTRDREAAFVQRLGDELRALAPLTKGQPLRTVFIGGGTPSLLSDGAWQRLLADLHGAFRLGTEHEPAEFTVECNPESVRHSLAAILAEGGVNRVSLGAQSFDAHHLATLERRHDPARVSTALAMLADAGIERRSIDLMYAIPDQTLDELARDLDAALALPIDHLSAYNLTYEPNTAMTTRLHRGEFLPTGEDLELAMFDLIAERAADAGFDRYEVSNYARPGGECRHNLAYWRQEPWLAAGPSASAHVGGHRYKVVPRLDSYLQRSDQGLPAINDHEPPDAKRLIAETIMTGLRLREGVDGPALTGTLLRIDPGAGTALQEEVEACRARGWLTPDASRWTLTPAGLPLADHVASELMSRVLA
ncbi:MAG: radical SAM family heme chaperone HemW [Planctomycetota bacterium]